MVNYVFSEEIYKKEYGKPKGKGRGRLETGTRLL